VGQQYNKKKNGNDVDTIAEVLEEELNRTPRQELRTKC